MGYIYKIYNDINDKVYIGQTAKTIESRWCEHLYNANSIDRHLYFAMRKYGIDHFFIEEIEECDNEMLDDREIYWVSYYDSYNNGYNETLGGDGNRKYNPAIFIELWQDGFSCKEIADEMGCATHTVTSWLQSYGVSHQETIQRRATKRHKRVYQYDLQGNLIKIFNSVLEAKHYFGYLSSGAVSAAIQFHYDINNSLLVFEEDVSNISEYIKNHKYRHGYKPVLQYDINGILISSYNTVKEAAKAIEGKELGIINVCKRRRVLYKNYLWKYEDDDTDIQVLVKQCKSIGIKGVHWDKKLQKWYARIYINGIQMHLGYFLNRNDAIVARLLAEKDHLGDLSPQKYLFEQYNI